MAKRTTKPSLPRKFEAISETFEKLDYRNPDIQRLYAQVQDLSTSVTQLQAQLAKEREARQAQEDNLAALEYELDCYKQAPFDMAVNYVTMLGAEQLDMTDAQMKRIVHWMLGLGMIDISIAYREELRDLLIDLSEWMAKEEAPYSDDDDDGDE